MILKNEIDIYDPDKDCHLQIILIYEINSNDPDKDYHLQMILRQRKLLEEQARVIRHLRRRLAVGTEAVLDTLHAHALAKVQETGVLHH